MAKWAIELDRLSEGGFSNKYWRETYPRSGTPNQAGRMYAMDLTNPGYIQPGPGLVVFDAVSATSTTITNFVENRGSGSFVGYGIGGSKIHQLSVSGDVALLHTVSAHANVNVTGAPTPGLDIYRSNLYYAWNHVSGADVGQYNLSSTFTDTWWTGTLSAAALLSAVPHPIAIGNNDVMYIANGRYIANYDGTTAQDKALDFPTNYIIQDIKWLRDRVLSSVSHSTRTEGDGGTRSSIYTWDGTTDSWEAEIPVNGLVGASYTLNDNFYQFYYDRTGEHKLALLDGSQVVDLVSWEVVTDNKLPRPGQVTDYKNFLIWVEGAVSDDMYAYGPLDGSSPRRFFHFADTGVGGIQGESGGITNMFSHLFDIILSNSDVLYYLDVDTKFQTTDALWKSQLFDIAGDRQNGGQINSVRFNFEKLVSGAVLDWGLVNSQGTTIYSDKISYAKATASNPLHTFTTAYYPLNGKVTEDFRVELNYANGSTTAPVRVKNIKLYGEG